MTPKVRVIYKYYVERASNATGTFPVTVHGSPFMLSARVEYTRTHKWGLITLYGKVDPEAEERDCWIRIVGTGHEAPLLQEAEFIDTVVQGPYVWHVYYEYPKVDYKEEA